MPSATDTNTTPTTNPPSPSHATPRRTLFGAAALLALATPARAADHNPDAELHALCAEFHRLNHDAHTLPDEGARTWEHAQAERWDVSDRLELIRPRTQDGRMAKAGVALALLEENTSGGTVTNGSHEDFVLATLRDLVGRATVSFRGAA